MSRKWWAGAVLVLIPIISEAQSSTDSATYKRAQTLVNDGNGVLGRAIVDSMITSSRPGTNEYAEGLYWRAVLSATAAEAESDYRRVIVDYPLSPRIEDALVRLAQLELARADYDGALQHLNRLTLEHPGGAARARAGYWTARVLFEKNDIQRACAASAGALAQTSENDAELRNQILYLNQRCVGVVIAPASGSAPNAATGSSVLTDSTGSIKADSTTLPKSIATAAITPKPVATSPIPAPSSPSKPPMRVPASPRDVRPSMIDPSAKANVPVSKPTPSKAVSAAEASTVGEFSVQVAAYNVRSQAEAMAAKLRKTGYEARISGSSAPFRVRIGHYRTQAQASAVMRSLKDKKIDAFVVKAESR